jgi:hypothetical protein
VLHHHSLPEFQGRIGQCATASPRSLNRCNVSSAAHGNGSPRPSRGDRSPESGMTASPITAIASSSAAAAARGWEPFTNANSTGAGARIVYDESGDSIEAATSEFSGGPVDISALAPPSCLSPCQTTESPPFRAPAVTVFSEWGQPRRFLLQSEIRSFRIHSAWLPDRQSAAWRFFIAGTNRSGTRVYRPATERRVGKFPY